MCCHISYLRDRELAPAAVSASTTDTIIWARGSGAHSTAATTAVAARPIAMATRSIRGRPPLGTWVGRRLATRTLISSGAAGILSNAGKHAARLSCG